MIRINFCSLSRRDALAQAVLRLITDADYLVGIDCLIPAKARAVLIGNDFVATDFPGALSEPVSALIGSLSWQSEQISAITLYFPGRRLRIT